MMNWKLPLFGGTQEPQPQSNFQEIPTQSWYPPSVVSSTSRPTTSSSSSGLSTNPKVSDHIHSQSYGPPSPSEAAGIIPRLREKSNDELRKLLSDKEAYTAFFNSIDQVKAQNNLRDELRRETLELAQENLENEPRMLELKNQCTIIRTTELAAAQEKLNDLERQKDEIVKSYSPMALLEKLHEVAEKVDEESEKLHQQLVDKEIDLAIFIQKYKKLRILYHRQSLLHLAAKTSGF